MNEGELVSQLERLKEYMRVWETLAGQLTSVNLWLLIELVKVKAEIVSGSKIIRAPM
jgi:hypothetical protein